MDGRHIYQNGTVWFAAGGVGILSIVVCTIALALLVAMRLHTYFTYRLVMYQTLSLMLLDFAYGLLLLQFVPRASFIEDICRAIGFLVVYTVWVNLLFSVCAVVHLFCFAVLFKSLHRFEPIYVALCVLLPLLYSWIPLVTQSYGSDNFLCFVETWRNQTHRKTDGVVEEFTLLYGPLVAVTGVNASVVLAMVAILIRRASVSRSRFRTECDASSPAAPTLNYKMEVVRLLFPLLFSSVFILGLILFPFGTRIYDASLSSQPPHQFELDLTIGIVAGLSGMFLGTALIIHLCYIRTKKLNKKTAPSASGALGSRQLLSYGATCRSFPSLHETMYVVPPESRIDESVRKNMIL